METGYFIHKLLKLHKEEHPGGSTGRSQDSNASNQSLHYICSLFL